MSSTAITRETSTNYGQNNRKQWRVILSWSEWRSISRERDSLDIHDSGTTTMAKGWTNWLHGRSERDRPYVSHFIGCCCCCCCQLSVKHVCDLLITDAHQNLLQSGLTSGFSTSKLCGLQSWQVPVAIKAADIIWHHHLCRRHARKGIWYGTDRRMQHCTCAWVIH